jgi:hypothetical protein
VNDQTPVAAQTDLLHGRCQTLLEISEAIASHRELDQPFRDLAPRGSIVWFEWSFLAVLLSHMVFRMQIYGVGQALLSARLSMG